MPNFDHYSLLRRRWLLGAGLSAVLPALSAATDAQATKLQVAVRLPRDGGAHPNSGIEWWYLTGWANTREGDARYGFQLTFFRRRVEHTQGMRSPLSARHLILADAAITDVTAGTLTHSQRLTRWSGAPSRTNPADEAWAAIENTDVTLANWSMSLQADGFHAVAQDAALALELHCKLTQPALLQGAQGLSRKGPAEHNVSHYYSVPQLAVSGKLRVGSKTVSLTDGGRAWLDHEWSGAVLPDGASGWDWIGINLLEGSALTAFRVRTASGASLWAGGSLRSKNQLRIFGNDEVQFEPQRRWISPLSKVSYPVAWRVDTPGGTFFIEAAVDAQEIDSRLTSGALYWEGLCNVYNQQQKLLGRGYLEMTGYGDRLAT